MITTYWCKLFNKTQKQKPQLENKDKRNKIIKTIFKQKDFTCIRVDAWIYHDFSESQSTGVIFAKSYTLKSF